MSKEIKEGERTHVEVHVKVEIREGQYVAHNQIAVEITKTVPVRLDERGAHVAVEQAVQRLVAEVERQAVGDLFDYNQRLRWGPRDHYGEKLAALKQQQAELKVVEGALAKVEQGDSK